jgi:hypothetical protein
MLTIPMRADAQTTTPSAAVLVVGRSEKVLRETVDLLRQTGRAAGATNDFDDALAAFDVPSVDLVVFGGMVPPETKETLRADIARRNPAITFIQGLAGIPGLLLAQVEAAAPPDPIDPAPAAYDADRRAVTISLRSAQEVRVIAFWGTAFVPPDPESTSRVTFTGTLDAGTHTLPLPPFVPAVASFVVVRVGAHVHPLVVGPMPAGTTMAPPPPGPRP